MKPFLLLFSALLFAACPPSPGGAPDVEVTAASEVTVTSTPAPTATIAVTPTPEGFALASLNLSPDLAASLKKHPGLEASITRETDGRFTAQVALLSPDGAAAPATLDVDPATLTENLALIGKNTYADTPVMIARDGTKLYWIKEYKTWYAKAAEAGSIHVPWRIPYGRPEISARMGIADHPEDFSPSAVERWSKHQYQNALGFQWRTVNYNTGEGKKFGYLDNMSISATDLTLENSPVRILPDDWYAMEMPDGTLFRYFQLKWLDPKDPRNPKADEWKIIQAAPGTEITENEANRKQFIKDLTETRGNVPVRFVLPIIKADEGFFNNPGLPTALPITQPSLAKLLDNVSDKFANLKVPVSAEPGEPNWTYGIWMNYWWGELGQDKTSGGFGFGIPETQYDDEIFSQQFQTFIFPAFVMRR